jgi:hypothetical protein
MTDGSKKNLARNLDNSAKLVTLDETSHESVISDSKSRVHRVARLTKAN